MMTRTLGILNSDIPPDSELREYALKLLALLLEDPKW